MDNPRVYELLVQKRASPIVGLQDLKYAFLDCYGLNRMSALLHVKRNFDFEQVKTETIRYHTPLQTALTYLNQLVSFDPDCCLGPLRCVYPGHGGSVHRFRSSIFFLCVCAALCRET